MSITLQPPITVKYKTQALRSQYHTDLFTNECETQRKFQTELSATNG